jgi:hypothetical protein
MDIDADDARRYFEDLDYPASKEQVVEGARGNDAPEELVERIASLSTPEFSSAEKVAEDLRASPRAG